jgi:hypothetical protein
MPVRLRRTEDAEPLAIDYRPIGSLIPYARNARSHSEAQVALIAGSIREYGFTNPKIARWHRRPRAGRARNAFQARKAMMPMICQRGSSWTWPENSFSSPAPGSRDLPRGPVRSCGFI